MTFIIYHFSNFKKNYLPKVKIKINQEIRTKCYSQKTIIIKKISKCQNVPEDH